MKKLLFLLGLGIKTCLRFVFGLISGGGECVICGGRTLVYPVCRTCIKTHFSVAKVLEWPRCRICGKPLVCEKDLCSVCREEPVLKSLDKMLPLFPYRLWNKELMFLWKTHEVRALSSLFAGLVERVLAVSDTKIIVPVPPRKGKIREKGWDQIDELCNLLEYRYGYKILRLLQRHTKVEQKKLDRQGRLEQIGKAYSCIPYKGELPEHVILLDDVCTTGSTMESCAWLLKDAGIKKVSGLTLFMVD